MVVRRHILVDLMIFSELSIALSKYIKSYNLLKNRIAIYFLKIRAGIKVDAFAVDNKEMDMRNVPSDIKKDMIFDEEVLKARWDLCMGCEFLTDANKCKKCGCFMKVKHKKIEQLIEKEIRVF